MAQSNQAPLTSKRVAIRSAIGSGTVSPKGVCRASVARSLMVVMTPYGAETVLCAKTVQTAHNAAHPTFVPREEDASSSRLSRCWFRAGIEKLAPRGLHIAHLETDRAGQDRHPAGQSSG